MRPRPLAPNFHDSSSLEVEKPAIANGVFIFVAVVPPHKALPPIALCMRVQTFAAASEGMSRAAASGARENEEEEGGGEAESN